MTLPNKPLYERLRHAAGAQALYSTEQIESLLTEAADALESAPKRSHEFNCSAYWGSERDCTCR